MAAVGSDRVRFTPYQKLIVLDVPDDKVEWLIDELKPLGLHGRPSHWRRNLLACSGIEFCKLSFTETRKRSQVLAPEHEAQVLGYLKSSRVGHGLLINFGSHKFEIRKYVWSEENTWHDRKERREPEGSPFM